MRQQKNPFPRSLGVMRGIITPGLVSQGSRKDRVVGTGQGRGQNRGQKLSGSEKDRRISWGAPDKCRVLLLYCWWGGLLGS